MYIDFVLVSLTFFILVIIDEREEIKNESDSVLFLNLFGPAVKDQ